MRFEIIRTQEGCWNVTALSGRYVEKVIARAEGVSLSDVQFSNKALSGNITAVWGLVLDECVYDDPSTLRGLQLGRAFDVKPGESLTPDFDGYCNRANRPVRSADRVMVMGKEVYAKGVR